MIWKLEECHITKIIKLKNMAVKLPILIWLCICFVLINNFRMWTTDHELKISYGATKTKQIL